MWSAERDRLLLVRAQEVNGLAIPRNRGQTPKWLCSEPISPDEAGPEGAIERCTTALAQSLGAGCASPILDRSAVPRVHVLVSDAWMPLVTVPWSSTLIAPNEREAHLRSQLLAAGHVIHPEDIVRMDDAPPLGQPRHVAAYPSALCRVLEATAKRLQGRLASVRPLSSALLTVLPRRSIKAAVLVDGTLMRHADLRGGMLPRLGRWGDDRDVIESPTRSLRNFWRRLTLVDESLAHVDPLHVISLDRSINPDRQESPSLVAWPSPLRRGAVPGGSQGEQSATRGALAHALLSALRTRCALDAIQTLRKTSPGATVAAALLWSAAAGTMAQSLWVETATHRAREAALAELRSSAQRWSQAPSLTRDEQARWRATETAIADLNAPLLSVLHALQAPRDIRVAVLAVDAVSRGAQERSHSSMTPPLKLTAEAATPADMARYLDYLQSRPEFSHGHLLRHDLEDSTSPSRLRFTVEVTSPP